MLDGIPVERWNRRFVFDIKNLQPVPVFAAASEGPDQVPAQHPQPRQARGEGPIKGSQTGATAP